MKTSTTKATAPAMMDAATIATAAAAVLKACKTISGIKTKAASYREKYGPKNWAAILSKAKEFRAADINAAAKGAIDAVFNYRAILGAAYRTLSADSNYKQLCKYAAASYKGTDADTAADLVSDYYANIDATTGAPLVRVDYVDEKTALIYTAYMDMNLTAVSALAVLKGAINGMKATARKAARKGADATTSKADNKRTAGAIVAVYELGNGPQDTFTRGTCIAGAKVAADATTSKARKDAAAALIGRPVPPHAARLAELNAAARAAHAAAADKALQEKRDAIAADAAAAGVSTTAPARKGRKASKASATTTAAS